jgi:uncharacterized membrane protein
MNPEHFLDRLEHHRIVDAIHNAESATTGHIRVYITHSKAPDPVAAALHRFHKLKLHHHRHRNAILIFLAPRSQTFAIVGDQSIHEKAGESAWQSMAATIGETLKSNQFMSAIIHGIRQAGDLLQTHFPTSPSSPHRAD